MDLATRMRPETIESVWGNNKAKNTLTNLLANEKRPQVYLFTGPAGCGKAQPLDSQILTKKGYVRMGDVFEGQKILDGTGVETEILHVYPQGTRDIYQIVFNDRTAIRVADNHINRVFRYNQDKKQKEYFDFTTMELIEAVKSGRFSYRVDVPVLDCWEEKPLPIDPYLLGLLIADGSLHNNFSITIAEDDIYERVSTLLSAIDYELIHIANFDYRIVCKHKNVQNQYTDRADTLKGKIEKLGLNCKSTEKHIPQEYLYTSVANRLSLLQGLFDGDGFISKTYGYYFIICSEQLSKDFAFLVRSLGIVDTISEKPARYRDKKGISKETSICYNHYLRVPNTFKIFRSKKHAVRYNKKQTEPIRKIVEIRYMGPEECQCIYVASEEHTYLTDNITVTHNTTLARAYASELGIKDADLTEINMSNHTGVDDARAIVEEAGYSIGDVQGTILDECHYMTANAQSCLLKLLEEPPAGAYYFLCTTDPQKLSAALKSRCIQIVVEHIDEDVMVKHLRKVCKAEGLRVSVEVLELIADKSEGVPRRALKLLDKVANMEEEEAINVLNAELSGDTTEDPDIKSICQALLKRTKNWSDISIHLKNVKSSDAEGVRRAIAGYLSAVLLNSGNTVAATALQEFTESLFASGFPGLVLQCFSAFTAVK